MKIFKFAKILFLFTCFYALPAKGNVFFSWSFNTTNNADNVEQFSFNNMNNFLFMGIAVTPKKQFVFGQSIVVYSKTHKVDGDTSQISLTEMGPKFILYFNEGRNVGFYGAYHPYTKGTQKIAGGESEKISGSSYLTGIIFHFRVTKNFYMGASFNYHAQSIAESVVDNTEETASYSYTSYFPAIELVLRW